MKNKFKQFEPLKVTWIDAHTVKNEWSSFEEIKESTDAPYIIKSIGFFYYQNQDYLVIMQSIDTNSQDAVSGIAIPIKNIKTIRRLR